MGRTGFFGTAAAVAFAGLLIAACVPTAENPIAWPGATPDHDIIGAWRGTMEDGEARVDLHFLRRSDGMVGAVLIATGDTPDSRDEWSVFRLVTTEVAGHRYMSALWDYNDGEPVTGVEQGYHLLRYAFEPDGSLALFLVNEDRLTAAVEAGELQGTIEEGDWVSEVRVTASSEDLVKYIEKSDPLALFDQPFARLSLNEARRSAN